MAGDPPYETCRVVNYTTPENWFATDFDDSAWPQAEEFTAQVGDE